MKFQMAVEKPHTYTILQMIKLRPRKVERLARGTQPVSDRVKTQARLQTWHFPVNHLVVSLFKQSVLSWFCCQGWHWAPQQGCKYRGDGYGTSLEMALSTLSFPSSLALWQVLGLCLKGWSVRVSVQGLSKETEAICCYFVAYYSSRILI